MKNNPIGFFDSGVGQLSVLKEAKKTLPKENFIVFADQANNPYGEKTRSEIQKYADAATKFLITKHQIKLMVLACNTATVLALDHLRKKFDMPFIGTVPAIKPAYKLSEAKRIAILSTTATAQSRYLKDLIRKNATEAKILKIGCDGLEDAIEILDKVEILKLIRKYTIPIKKFQADTVVLGCTHFPLFKKEISRELGKGVKVIDSGKAIAQRIKEVLISKNQLSSKKAGDLFYTTSDLRKFSTVASSLLKKKIVAKRIQVWNL